MIPVYNGERFLAEAVESVLAQSVPDWELIVVDDGSLDSTARIADEYAARDVRIRVLHVPNGGMSYARNRGIEVARGEWFCFVDADDELFPDALEVLLSGVGNDVDMVIGGYVSGGESRNASRQLPSAPRFEVMDPERVLGIALYQERSIHSAWAKIFSRRIFDDERFAEGLYYEDLEFFPRACLRSGSVALTERPVYFYRQHAESFLHRWSELRLDALRVTDMTEDFVSRYFPALLPAARDRKLSANFNIFILALRQGRRDVADGCWDVIRRYRRASLFNRRVRLKNKAGVLLSLLGRPLFTVVSKFF